MPIYRKVIKNRALPAPTSYQDIAGLSPIKIQAGSPDYSFQAILSINSLTLAARQSGWGIEFRIMQGSNILGAHHMGEFNGGFFQPSFTISCVGDVSPTGVTEDIHVQWMGYNVTAYLKARASFSIIWDRREEMS